MAVSPVMIYLAGPIDDVSHDEASGWRKEVAEMAPGVLFFNPVGAWFNAERSVAEMLDVGNRSAIMNSAGLLANLGGPGRGFGTIREIEFAARMNVAIAVAVSPPLASLLTYDLKQHQSLEAALMALLTTIAERRQEERWSLFRLQPMQEEDE